MTYLTVLCITNAVLLLAVAGLLWSSSRDTLRHDARLATELETLRCVVRRTTDEHAEELRRLQSLADAFRVQDRQRERLPETMLPLTQVNRLAGTAASAHELAELTGLSRAEAELLMNLRGPKAAAKNADNDQVSV